jgi:hypothetical protein
MPETPGNDKSRPTTNQPGRRQNCRGGTTAPITSAETSDRRPMGHLGGGLAVEPEPSLGSSLLVCCDLLQSDTTLLPMIHNLELHECLGSWHVAPNGHDTQPWNP